MGIRTETLDITILNYKSSFVSLFSSCILSYFSRVLSRLRKHFVRNVFHCIQLTTPNWIFHFDANGTRTSCKHTNIILAAWRRQLYPVISSILFYDVRERGISSSFRARWACGWWRRFCHDRMGYESVFAIETKSYKLILCIFKQVELRDCAVAHVMYAKYIVVHAGIHRYIPSIKGYRNHRRNIAHSILIKAERSEAYTKFTMNISSRSSENRIYTWKRYTLYYTYIKPVLVKTLDE